MRRSLAILALFAASAHADRKDAPPDTPPFSELTSVVLELGAPPDGGTCQPATWTIHVDLARDHWQRSDRSCTVTKGAERVSTTTRQGALKPSVRAELAKHYANLDARVPRICNGGTEKILTARLVRRDGMFVTLVDRGCERPAYLRVFAAVVSAL